MRPQERPLADASGFLGLVPQTASALEEAARRLGENAEALLSRVNRSAVSYTHLTLPTILLV